LAELSENGKKLTASGLILNPEIFTPQYEPGFSVGFWFNRSSNFSRTGMIAIIMTNLNFKG
jgi:hypothetical protein